MFAVQFASVPMAVSPYRPTSSITTGIFETGTPTVLTSTVTWRSHGSRINPSTSASSSTYGRSPVTFSSVTWTCKRSSCRGYRSSVAEPSSSSISTTTSSRSSSQCVRCTTWRCRPSEVRHSLACFFFFPRFRCDSLKDTNALPVINRIIYILNYLEFFMLNHRIRNVIARFEARQLNKINIQSIFEISTKSR